MAAPFARPSSAILCGYPGPLLNWVALGFATAHPGGYFWTDVRLAGQLVDEADPLARGNVPADRLSVVEPQVLARPQPDGTPKSAAARSETAAPVRRLTDLRGLPEHTRELLATRGRAEPPALLVLSNGHRIASQYPPDVVGPVLRAILEAGASILVTFPDEPPRGRLGFENVWHLKGETVRAWRSARLEVERGTFDPPFATGNSVVLRDLPAVADLLTARGLFQI